MNCSNCDDLRRRLLEMNDELEAWRANSADDAIAADAGERLRRWRLALGARTGVCLTLMAMADRAPRILTKDQIVAVTRHAVGARKDYEPGRSLAVVYIYLTRQALKGAGVEVSVSTLWGQGYFLPVAAARALKLAVGEDA